MQCSLPKGGNKRKTIARKTISRHVLTKHIPFQLYRTDLCPSPLSLVWDINQTSTQCILLYASLVGPVADEASGYPRNDLPGPITGHKKYLQFRIRLNYLSSGFGGGSGGRGCRCALQQARRARTLNKFASDGPRERALYYYCGGLLGDSKNIKQKYIHRYNLRSAGQRAWKFLTPL